MPKIRLCAEDKVREDTENVLMSKLAYYQRLHGLNTERMGKVAGVCHSTWTLRVKEPKNITVGELCKLAARFKVPVRSLFEEVQP